MPPVSDNWHLPDVTRRALCAPLRAFLTNFTILSTQARSIECAPHILLAYNNWHLAAGNRCAHCAPLRATEVALWGPDAASLATAAPLSDCFAIGCVHCVRQAGAGAGVVLPFLRQAGAETTLSFAHHTSKSAAYNWGTSDYSLAFGCHWDHLSTFTPFGQQPRVRCETKICYLYDSSVSALQVSLCAQQSLLPIVDLSFDRPFGKSMESK